MSRNTKNVTKKPYCKVCQDAGKPESEYTSHWVKDLTGKTTCPTLLNTECRYCCKLGHTAKFCDVLAKNNKEKERAECSRRTQVVKSRKQPAPAVQKKAANKFFVFEDDNDSEEEEEVSETIVNEYPDLCEPAVQKKSANQFFVSEDDNDSEEEEEVSKTIVNEYPVLCEPAKKNEAEVKTSWAAIAAKPKETMPVREPEFTVLTDYIKNAEETKPVIDPKSGPRPYKPKPIQMKSWADWSDSDDDDEIPSPPVLRRSRNVIGYNMPNNIEDFLSDDEEMPKFPPVLRRENAVWSASNNYTWH